MLLTHYNGVSCTKMPNRGSEFASVRFARAFIYYKPQIFSLRVTVLGWGAVVEVLGFCKEWPGWGRVRHESPATLQTFEGFIRLHDTDYFLKFPLRPGLAPGREGFERKTIELGRRG